MPFLVSTGVPMPGGGMPLTHMHPSGPGVTSLPPGAMLYYPGGVAPGIPAAAAPGSAATGGGNSGGFTLGVGAGGMPAGVVPTGATIVGSSMPPHAFLPRPHPAMNLFPMPQRLPLPHATAVTLQGGPRATAPALPTTIAPRPNKASPRSHSHPPRPQP